MKTMKKIFAVCLALMMTVSCIPSVYAAERMEAPVDPALIDELSAVILEECRSGVMFNYNYDYSPWELTVYLAGQEPVELWIPETAVETIAWLEANCTITE